MDCSWRGYYTEKKKEGLLKKLETIRTKSCGQRIPYTQPGYWSNAECPVESWRSTTLEVYVCRNSYSEILTDVCPGGPPGTCREHHTGISCADCVEGFRLNAEGRCTEC